MNILLSLLMVLLVANPVAAAGIEDMLTKTTILPNIRGFSTVSLPTPAVPGRLAYDTTRQALVYDTGSAWTLVSSGGGGGGGASTLDTFLTATDNTADIPNSINLGSLATGFLKCVTSGGVCTVSTDPAVVSTGSPNTYAAGNKQTFSPNTTDAGINVGAFAGDPSLGVNGDVVYNSTAGKFRCFQAGSWTDCIPGAGATAFSAVTAGTNTAALVVGTGGSLTVSGTGTINATKLNNITVSPTNQDANHLMLGDGSWKNCADGLLITWAAGAIGCGSVDAATRALDNLASVAINSALLPASAAGVDFGSATKPWKDFYLAGTSLTPGTNNYKITGVATAARTITLPDASFTAAGADIANTWGDGIKQTFNPNATNPGINVGSVAGDPSTPANGDIWYETGTNKFRCRENGATANCIGAAGGSNNFVMSFSTGSGGAYSFVGAANTTYNVGMSEFISTGSGAAETVCIPVPVTGTIKSVYYRIRMNGTGGTVGQLITHRINNVTAATTTTGFQTDYSASNATGSETGLSFAVTAGDCITLQIITPNPWTTTSTNTKVRASVYVSVP